MRLVNSKTVIAVALGALLLAGAAAPILAQAAPGDQARPAKVQHQYDPAKAAARLADVYGLDQAAVQARLNSGTSPRDANRAAFLAKASGKSFDEVLGMKKSDNTWKDIAQSLGVTREQMKAARQAMTSDRMSAKLDLDRATVADLLGQGYKARDIGMAGLLAQNADKPVASVLDQKKLNNTWRDVAQSMGVSDDTLKQDMQKMRQAFGGHRGGHHRFGNKSDK
jgi:hypothetical protein